MSIRKVKNRSGEIKWEVRVYENGRGSRRICNRFDRKSDAEAWAQDFDKKKAERVRNPFSSITFEGRSFEQEATYWINDGENRFSPGHLVKVKAIIKEILERFGNLPVEKITPEFLTQLQQGELRAGRSPATANRKTEVLTTIMNHSVKHRRIPFNPATGFRKLRKSQKEMEFWSLTEAQDFLAHIGNKYPAGSKDRWVYLVYLIALNTGLRAGEIWGLRPSDVSEPQSAILVRRQFNRVSLSFTPPKSRKPRAVPANQELLREVKDWIRSKKIGHDDTIFQNDQRRPICHENFIARRFKHDLRTWAGRPIRFHDLRHTATTLMIASQVDLKTVKEICGHSDIATTMNYVHLVSGAIEKVALNFSITPVKNEEVKSKFRIVG